MRILVLCFVISLILSCQKDAFTSDPGVQLSLFTDTLTFDTVFANTGSATQSFKIFNNHSKGLRVSSIKLGGGNASPFRMNVNGEGGPAIGNLELPAGDSAYVFIAVKINPTQAQLPFVVNDSVEISYNGNRQVVYLQAYGQNARFMRNRVITDNEVWTRELPYVVLGRLEVAPGATLTIEKGTRIYVHASAPITVRGTLVVRGDAAATDRVQFSGDRLDEPYRNFPGSWQGIRFAPGSRNNMLQYAVVRNAYQAIYLEGSSSGQTATLAINETIIDHAFDAGIFSLGGNITARNLLVSNCGKNLVLAGGQYLLEHCTIAGYNTRYLQRKDPLVQLANTTLAGSNLFTTNLSATFRNCIIWGTGAGIENEVALSPAQGSVFSVGFDHVLWKEAQTPAAANVTAAIIQEPEFRMADAGGLVFDFRLQPSSPAVNKGKASSVTIDLDGARRPVGASDIGAYEVQ